MTRSLFAAGAIAVLLGSVIAGRAQAQGRSTGASTSAFGATATSGFGASSASSGFGATSGGFGSTSGGFGSTGSTGFGQTSGGFGQTTGSTGFGQTSGGFGQTTGLGQGYNAFSQQLGYSGLTSQTGVGGQTGGRLGQTTLGGQTNRAGQQGRLGQGTTQTVQNAQPPMPVRLRLVDGPARPAATTVAANVQSSLDRVLASRNIGGMQVSLDGDVTVLTGRAATESQRLLIERVASLQPGVGTIRNDIVVAPEEESNQ